MILADGLLSLLLCLRRAIDRLASIDLQGPLFGQLYKSLGFDVGLGRMVCAREDLARLTGSGCIIVKNGGHMV